MLERREAGGVVWYESALLRRVGVRHAFSTRLGGVSTGPFASLNLGNPSGAQQDSRTNIEQNYRRILEAVGYAPDQELCRVHQVHGPGVATLCAGDLHNPHAQADALVSDDPARVLSVRVADCVPVILASADGRRVGVVHAGWRGVASGVVRQTVRAMAGTDAGEDLLAAIGPGIGPEAFEVEGDVIGPLETAFARRASALEFIRAGKPGKWHVDLGAALAVQLRLLRVREIDATDRCTFRDAQEFFSHRRDRGVTGRMAAFASAAPPVARATRL